MLCKKTAMTKVEGVSQVSQNLSVKPRENTESLNREKDFWPRFETENPPGELVWSFSHIVW